MSTARRRWIFAIKAIVSVSLLGWLCARMVARDGVDVLGARLEGLDYGWLGIAVALHLGAVGAGVARWRLLLRASRIALSTPFLLRSYLVGRFVGAFTPSTTGLDGWRLYEAGRASGAMGRSAAAIAIEKLVGLIGMALVCATLIPMGGVRLMGPTAIGIAAAMGAGAALALWLAASSTALRRVARRVPGPLRARAERAAAALAESRLSHGDLARAVALGVGSHLALSAVFVATAHAIGVDASSTTLLVVGNAIVLAVLLPVSVGGVGVREGVAVVLLAGAGVSSTDAVLVALLGYLTGQVPALLGGALLTLRRAPTPALEPAET